MTGIKKYVKKNYTDIIVFISVTLVVVLFMSDILQYGIHFDEVNRYNPIYAIFNKDAYPNNQAIWSIELFGRDVPMMYKEYISAWKTFYYLPIVAFANTFVATRVFYVVCFVVQVLVLYYYMKRINSDLAMSVSLLVMLNPLLYPDFNYGFASLSHLFFLIIGVWLMEKYYTKDKTRYLFFGLFVLAFGASFSFYFIWTIVALVVSSFIINFDVWKNTVCKIKSILAAFFGVILGLFPFVSYNVLNGFPTVKVFLTNIFAHDEFQMDHIQEESFLDGLKATFSRVDFMLNDRLELYIILCVVNIIIWAILAVLFVRKKTEMSKYNFYPVLILVITIACITISPKPRFAYHWLHVVPFFEISFVLGVYYICKLVIPKYYKVLVCSIIGILVLFDGFNGYAKTQGRKTSVDKHNISMSIIDINDYFIDNGITSEEILFLEWGLEAPIYFLNRGEIADANDKLYYSLMDLETEQIEGILFDRLLKKNNKTIYIPLYDAQNIALSYDRVREALLNVLEEYNFEYEIIDYYDEEVNNLDLFIVDVNMDNAFSANDIEKIDNIDQLEVADNAKIQVESIENIDNYQVVRGWMFVEGIIIKNVYLCDSEGNITGIANYGIDRGDVYEAMGKVSEARNSGYSFIVSDYDNTFIVVEDIDENRYIIKK